MLTDLTAYRADGAAATYDPDAVIGRAAAPPSLARAMLPPVGSLRLALPLTG